ncbi:hypothetical protein AYL99_02705 [Fonsecaea erecta]|uniref:N-acetyltransferase domain-containing protein n=1 Tax=Fonsecaea erecta TaxID=1367422 RepID=A0A178ZUN7_9EURO|nr:hypothetical protein AYL99_02705 [Fonsecaea erecta]OAP63478.1 hypothetical protein AYL99_02705 [Fonsecaea erecta]
MVTTRAKGKAQGEGTAVANEGKTGTKRSRDEAPKTKTTEPKTKQQKKDQVGEVKKTTVKGARDDGGKEKDRKKASPKSTRDQKKLSGPHGQKIEKLLQHFGALPLSNTDLDHPDKATPETVLALLLNAILSSTRVSHSIAAKTTALVIKAGYHKLDVLKKSSWEERTQVLTEGGYTHYREKTATFMGQLAERVEEKYEGDLNTLVKTASQDPAKIRAELQKIKGIGDVGIDIFFTTAQHVWPCLAPWIDPRSLKTAEHIGLGSDVQALWEEVDQKPELMCRLACALMEWFGIMAEQTFHYEQRRLENDLVALVPFEPTVHAAPFVEMIKAHPEMFSYIPFPVINDEADFMKVYEGIHSSPADCLFAVLDKKQKKKVQEEEGLASSLKAAAEMGGNGNTFAGVVSLMATNPTNAVTEVGVMIFPAFQRTHVATNAIGLLLFWTLDPPAAGGLALRRVVWQTHAGNAVSRRTATRLGFEFEGIARWDRVFPRCRGSEVGLSAEALRVRNGTPGEEQPGRHTAVYSIVWDEWDDNKRPRIAALMMERK